MVSKINNIQEIEWFDQNPGLNLDDLKILTSVPFAFPKQFLGLLQISNGGSIDYSFNYYDVQLKELISSDIGSVFAFNSGRDCINLEDEYNCPPEFFPKNLVAFAENGGGDMVCFDYRTDSKTDNPPIVYWRHDADIGKDVSFVANNFEEFIKMLEVPDDEEFEKLYNESKKNS